MRDSSRFELRERDVDMEGLVRANTGMLPMRSDIAGDQLVLFASQRGPVRALQLSVGRLTFNQRTQSFRSRNREAS